tara:strand:- start:42 stop:2474 length:2433 start_codon:yes stop_codon:yes gene_type:complete
MLTLSPDLTYREDIDGLRAIAVLAVVIYHAGSTIIPGGFVGVDIFFVLSGYLITQRLVAGFQNRLAGGSFTIKEFFIRRVRRLFPAMAATVALSIIAGFFILTPSQLVTLAQAAVAAVLSVANIFFYSIDDYWGPASETLPLLHFWSLAVEEQFYLIWPVLIFFLATRRWITGLAILVILFSLSLIVTSWASQSVQSASFYLTPFRIYEFVIGAVCVWFDRVRRSDAPLWALVRATAFVSGLSLIGLSFVLISADSPFPGWQALLPCIGTAAVIMARSPKPIGFVLSNPIARHFGLISYSMYLVHWPIIVYANMLYVELTVAHHAVILLLIYASSLALYVLVETPLRRPITGFEPKFTANGAFRLNMSIYASVSAAFVGGCALIIFNGGFIERVDQDRRIYAEMADGRLNEIRYFPVSAQCSLMEQNTVCGAISSSRPNFVVLGDSFGTHGYSIARAAFPGANIIVSTVGRCPFLVSETEIEGRECFVVNEGRRAWVETFHADLDGFLIANQLRQGIAPNVAEAAEWLSQFNLPVAMLGGSPIYSGNALDLMAAHGTDLRAYELRGNWVVADTLKQLVESYSLMEVWEPRDLFCSEERCQTVRESDGHPIIIDTNHLSLEAARQFGEWLRDGRLGAAFNSLVNAAGTREAELPELEPLSVVFDGSNVQAGRLDLDEDPGRAIVSLVLKSNDDAQPDAPPYSDTWPPMPLRIGSLAVYQFSDYYKIAVNADILVTVPRDNMLDPLRLDVVYDGQVVQIFVDEVATYEIETSLTLNGAYSLGRGYRQRYWNGELLALRVETDSEVYDLTSGH